MRSQDLALLLASVALIGVVALALFESDAAPAADPGLDRSVETAPDAPMLDMEARSDATPSLGGPSQGLAEEVRRLRNRVAVLDRELAALREQHEKLADAVDPVRDVLEVLQAQRPQLLKARQTANETASIATLRNLTSALAQVQVSGRVDEDEDGVGEYAGFRELSGAVPGRMARVLVPPVLSQVFRTLSAYGEAERSGTLFRFYLPGPRGEGIGEPEAGFDASSGIDPDLAETTWCCYAWPAERGASRKTFFMNQAGDTLFTEADYAGPGGGPPPDAAFQRAGAITGQAAVNQRGSDGNTWRRAR